MAFVVADRVQETCTSPGTATVTLLGAVSQFQTFSSAIGANNTTYYVIADQVGANWEVGLGTVGAGGTTLARTTVLASSNGGSIVNFLTGNQYVWVDYPASKIVVQGGAVSFSSITNSGLASGRVVYTTTGGLETSSASFLYDGTALTAGNFVPSSATVPTYGMYLPITNAIGFTTASTERMRIDSAGNVGIGITSPSGKFHVAGGNSFFVNATTSQLYVRESTTGNNNTVILKADSTSAQIIADYITTGIPLLFNAGGSERMRIYSSGGVSIGNTTDPGASNLSVTGTIASSSVITGGFSNPAAGTTAMAFGSYNVVKVTPNATATFTSTVPAAGTTCTLIVLTSGTTSYTITFGTGFKTTGTLATGTVSARYFQISFVSDGTNLLETARTTAIA